MAFYKRNVSSLTGTSNQVSVSAATGAVTLSTPQNTDTGAAVQVGTLKVGGSTGVGSAATITASSAAYNGEAGGFCIALSGTTTKRLAFGWDDTLQSNTGEAWIQAVHNGSATKHLLLNPIGGNVSVAKTNPTHAFELGSDDAAKTTTTTWSTTSDVRTKKNIKAYTDGLAEVLQLSPVRFQYNGKGGTVNGEEAVSIIAQDVLAKKPDSRLIKVNKRKLNDQNDPDEPEIDMYAFNPHELFFMFINAFKELSDKVKSLEAQLETKSK